MRINSKYRFLDDRNFIVYVDVNTGSEYKWDPKKNQFIRVGKYRAK